MKRKYELIGVAALLLVTTIHTQAIEDLKLTIHCPDVVLSWPSVEGENYIVQWRETLGTNTPWVTLTNYLPAETGTNITTFTHSNRVDCPTGQIFGMMFSGATGGGSESENQSEKKSYLTEHPMVIPADGLRLPVPLAIYPPGIDLSGYIIIWPDGSTSEWSAKLVEGWQAIQQAERDGPETEDAGGGAEPGTGFYWVVRDGVHIVNLAGLTNGFKDGSISIVFEAGNERGGLLDASLLVDGTRYRGATPLIAPGINGRMTVDTSFLENGDHSVQLKVTWSNPDIMDVENTIFERYSDAFTLSVSNEVYFPDWQDELAELGNSSLFAKTVHSNAAWKIDIYDVSNNFVQTLTGTAVDDVIEASWDMMDWQGNFRTNGAVDTDFYSFITIPYGGIMPLSNQGKPTPPKKAVNPYPEHGSWAIAYQDIFQGFVRSNMLFDAIYQFGGLGAQFGGAYTVFPSNPTNGQVFPLRYPFTNNPVSFLTFDRDDKALLTLLTNASRRNFYYFGHGTPNGIAGLLTSETISYALRRHYYRFVFLDGCSTAAGALPAAFGINFNSPKPLSYFQKHGMRPRAYMGNSIKVKYAHGGEYIDPSTGLKAYGNIPESVAYFKTNFQFYWYFNYDLVSAVYYAIQATPYLGPEWDTGEYLKIYGYDGLRIDEYNWKSDWSN